MTVIVLATDGKVTVYTDIKSIYTSALLDMEARTYIMPMNGEQVEVENFVKLEVVA
jgi:hypothetical protein